MKEIKRFNVGSSVFFNGIKDFSPKDNDILLIMRDWKPKRTNVLNFKDKSGNDVFLYKELNKEDFINDTIKSNVPMRAGKFLVPEVNEYFGVTISDLKRLKPLFDNMDEKHRYEQIIFESYIENNSFHLTDNQRMKAFCEYNNYKKTNN